MNRFLHCRSVWLLLWILAVPSYAPAADEVGLLELVNYYEYSPQLMSSGQPQRGQFAAIHAAGVNTVINLAPVSAPDALPDEGDIVRGLGMNYVHIPVDWEQPTTADVGTFLDAMAAHASGRVLVHCYANARASAFVYLYRILRAGHNHEEAYATLTTIWDWNPGYELDNVPHWQQLLVAAESELATRD